MTWVDLWPTVSLMSWIGTPLLLMIETAVWRPSWACQWPMPARPGHLAEAPVERVGRVGVAVLVAEHEVVVVPGFAGGPAFGCLALVCLVSAAIARFGRTSERFDLRRLGVAALARRAPDVDHSPIEVYVVPRELAQLARAQAERDREDEQRFEPYVGVRVLVEAELRAARAARRRPSARCSLR